MYTFDFAIGGILSQPDEGGVLHPVAYYSRKFTAPKINYPIMTKSFSLSFFLSKNGGPIYLGRNTVSK
jgi:hypothetical protein